MATIGKTHISSVLINVFDDNTFEIKMSKNLEISKVYNLLVHSCATIEEMMDLASDEELKQFAFKLKH